MINDFIFTILVFTGKSAEMYSTNSRFGGTIKGASVTILYVPWSPNAVFDAACLSCRSDEFFTK